jgi:hypothetical protein
MTRFVESLEYRTIVPGASPTRGSGEGADVDMSIAGVAPYDPDDEADAHAAA